MGDRPRILVTRPLPDAEATAIRLEALGFEPVIAPIMEMVLIDAVLPSPHTLAALAVTSANALRALEAKSALSPYLGLPVFCVGTRTADAARAAGFTTVHDARGAFDDLVALIAASHIPGPLLYPAIAHPAGDLAAALAHHHIPAVTATVYDMRPISAFPPAIAVSLTAGTFAAVSLYSRHTAEIFVRLTAGHLDTALKRHIIVMTMSENAAKPLQEAGFTELRIAPEPSESGMMALAAQLANGQIAKGMLK